jgi:hydroxymethylglutaryl-CoA lyase
MMREMSMRDTAYPDRVEVVEVGPRDGLQNERVILSVPTRVQLIKNLLAAGLKTIEAGSFVSPKWVPQMAGTAEVLSSLPQGEGISYPVLVPNLKGLDQARHAGAQTLAVFAAATEAFSKANLNAGREQALERFAAVIREAVAAGLRVRGYVSCAVHCPFEGWVDPVAVAHLASELMHLGCYEVSLCDTTGHATPDRSVAMVEATIAAISREFIAVHFHDTKGRALENTEACLRLGMNLE